MNDPIPEPTPAPTPQPEPTPAPRMVGDDGKFTKEFRDSLPDGLGEHSSFDKYGSAVEYFNGSVNSFKMNGQKAEDFWASEDPSVIEKRLEIMGVPKEASAYEYDPVDLAEGMPKELIAERIKASQELYKDLGLNKTQAKALIEADLSAAVEQWNSAANQRTADFGEQEAELRKDPAWSGEKMLYNTDKVKDAFRSLGLDDYIADVDQNIKFRKDMFEKIVPLISDDTIIEARQTQNFASISDQLDTVEHKMYAYEGDTSAPEYKALIAQRTKLLEQQSKIGG